MIWIEIKTLLAGLSGLERDALHILSGLGLHIALVLISRSWFGAFWPVAIIAALALGNEWIDLSSDYWVGEGERARQYTESAKDLMTTLSAPLALLLLSRFAPARLRRGDSLSE